MKSYKYNLEGLDCANCAKKIEEKIANEKGYKNVIVNFSTSKLSFQREDEKEDLTKEVEELVHSLEPDVIVTKIDTKKEKQTEPKNQRNGNDIFRIIIGVAIYFVGVILPASIITKEIKILLTGISLIVLLARIIPKAWIQITKNHILDENTLITISSIGACFVGEAIEGIMVITLYEIGKILEAKAVNKTRKSISSLMDICPEYANLKVNEETKQVAPEEVNVGDIIVIKSGEKIPLDGIVVKGEAEIDNSALIGESKIERVEKNSKILSGAINVQGLLEVKVTQNYENSTVSQILNLVENATDKKAKTENLVSKASKIYTPIVLGFAILVAVFMPILFKNVSYNESIYKALIFLVISCPCSIAISVPLSYFTGIGKASKKGILVKGSDYLDGLKHIGEIIFDKTGTITTGDFKVSKITAFDEKYTEEQILNYFAIGESFSNHPIAKSILKEVEGQNLDIGNVEEFEEVAGKGISYKYKDKLIKIGNKNFVGLNTQINETIGTSLYLKIGNNIVGNILLTDEIKPKANQTIEKLKLLGIKTKIFTGDKREIAEKIGKEVGIEQVKSEMLPQNKFLQLEKILEENSIKTPNKKVAYVGDGINDSPVLARADIGISMGGIGSSSAIEASDVVIMTDELEKIVEGINISKKTSKIIKQNLIFALGVKILTFILSLLGVSNMWEAVFADVGTTLLTILNTLRILK